jgi:hypothetical protein
MLKYVVRASIAIPLVVAVGFALAAIASVLANHFGYVAAYGMMAGGLTLIGVVAALVVSANVEKQDS